MAPRRHKCSTSAGVPILADLSARRASLQEPVLGAGAGGTQELGLDQGVRAVSGGGRSSGFIYIGLLHHSCEFGSRQTVTQGALMYLFNQHLRVSNSMIMCDVWVQEVMFWSSEKVQEVGRSWRRLRR